MNYVTLLHKPLLTETYDAVGGAMPVVLVVMVTASSLAKLHLHSNREKVWIGWGKIAASDSCPWLHISVLFLSPINKQESITIKKIEIKKKIGCKSHRVLAARGSVVVKALRCKPKVAGSRPDAVNF
jgi:hypothetical protein